MSKEPVLTVVIRATGESTLKALESQLEEQLGHHDHLLVLDDYVSFEKKLEQGFKLAIQMNTEYSVFIDADILLRRNAIKKIKAFTKLLDDSDLGFGLLLWDRFYGKAKYRGLHVYRTRYIKQLLGYIPEEGTHLRPESYVKREMMGKGHEWRNNLTKYVVGIHDFYQKPEDIYYKFLIRAKRSSQDLAHLKKRFTKNNHTDFKIALKALDDSTKYMAIKNNKFEYRNTKKERREELVNISGRVDLIVLKNLILRYGVRKKFWKYV